MDRPKCWLVVAQARATAADLVANRIPQGVLHAICTTPGYAETCKIATRKTFPGKRVWIEEVEMNHLYAIDMFGTG